MMQEGGQLLQLLDQHPERLNLHGSSNFSYTIDICSGTENYLVRQ